ncbi:DUF1365 domain-containing protein [Desulfopila sp. IMCC35006]|uniref:DUF1365 domain-containing protein n=1 Tax=Desulfopila sp. IMCC35006 TaxID=2569542 RepID=UPI0010AB961D|nr:DUF1365 domain-containing protein [Desulfopila sp. IMCC35006]TKB24823.1 DUF1365 domain-containing protein [Desulfopila sp. IMCC35006]
MKPALYVGTIAHKRQLPVEHRFQYRFFMWFLNLDELDALPSVFPWFSTTRRALSRFYRPDYYGDPAVPLAGAIRNRMEELTGRPVTGQVCGLLNMRTLGVYFSPVNFYYGYDGSGILTHFLAEVSNIPWNERHQYAHYVGDNALEPDNAKQFRVSPFNSIQQHYSWKIKAPAETLTVQLGVDDERGRVFQAFLNLRRHPFARNTVTKELLRRPAMTLYIIAGIYWQAFKLYRKGVPYVPYEKEMI